MGPRGAWSVVLASVAACSFGERGNDPSRYAVRDSAGIEIVESSGPGWADGEAWSISGEPLFVIHASDGGDENILLDPSSIDVDARGRVIVADGYMNGWDAILVYDSTGALLFRAGRDGEGPGEFGQLWWASTYAGDSIVGYDMSGNTLSVFDPDGRFVREVRTPPVATPRGPRGSYGYVAGIDAAFGDGSLLAYPSGAIDADAAPGVVWYHHLLLRVHPDGRAWDTLGSFPISEQMWDGNRQQPLHLGHFAASAVGDDELYFGDGTAFEIGRYDAEGNLTRLIRRSWEPRQVTDELKEAYLDWLMDRVASSPEASEEMLSQHRTRLASSPFSETLPAYSHFLLDADGYLWVESFRGYPAPDPPFWSEPGTWSIFDPDGRWLGDVAVPEGFVLWKVTRTRALGFTFDDTGVKEIEVHGLDRPAT